MSKIEKELSKAGYSVVNVTYPSRTSKIHVLAATTIKSAMDGEQMKDCTKIHFVTHSLGGILVRSYFKAKKDKRLGRVVMLAPPNQGSEVVDRISNWKLFNVINGPAGKELSTKPDSVPNKLGPINFECGVITGDRSINWINSLMIPGKDDGKVSVTRSKVEGLKEHRVYHVTHTFIMKRRRVIKDVVHFIANGYFQRSL